MKKFSNEKILQPVMNEMSGDLTRFSGREGFTDLTALATQDPMLYSDMAFVNILGTSSSEEGDKYYKKRDSL